MLLVNESLQTQIIDLITKYHHAITEGNIETQKKIKEQISALLAESSTNTEDSGVTSSFKNLIAETELLAEFNKRLNPLTIQADKIEKLEEKLSPIYVLYQNWIYVLGIVVVLAGFAGYSFIAEVNDMQSDALSTLDTSIKAATDKIETEIKYQLDGNSIIRTVQTSLERRFAERYWQGAYGDMIDDTSSAISRINDRRRDHDYSDFKPTRMDEATLVLYTYAQQLGNYSKLSIHEDKDFLKALNCTPEGFIYSQKLTSKALRSWADGFQTHAYQDLKHAYQRCRILEAPILDLVLKGASRKGQNSFLLNDLVEFNKAYDNVSKKPLLIKTALGTYYNFIFPIATRTLEPKNYSAMLVAFNVGSHEGDEKWRVVKDFYENSVGPLVKNEGDKDKKIIESSKETLLIWPGFIKAKNQILSAVSNKTEFIDPSSKEYSYNNLDYYFIYRDIFNVYLNTNDIDLFDSLARSAIVLIEQLINKKLVLTISEEQFLISSTKMVLTKLCESEQLRIAYDRSSSETRSQIAPPASHLQSLTKLLTKKDGDKEQKYFRMEQLKIVEGYCLSNWSSYFDSNNKRVVSVKVDSEKPKD